MLPFTPLPAGFAAIARVEKTSDRDWRFRQSVALPHTRTTCVQNYFKVWVDGILAGEHEGGCTNMDVCEGICPDVRLVLRKRPHVPFQGSAEHEGGTFVTTPGVSARTGRHRCASGGATVTPRCGWPGDSAPGAECATRQRWEPEKKNYVYESRLRGAKAAIEREDQNNVQAN
jgi:hypothetical protein